MRLIAIAIACLLTSPVAARTLDANGNVVSHKTGATARVSPQYAARFQAYIDAIEATGASVRFMGGTRRGRCSSSSMHPCGKALDVCQTGRGRVDARCHLPSRHELARIAAAHGLVEGGRWQHSDYGHAQVGGYSGAAINEMGPSNGIRRKSTTTASARSRKTNAASVVAPPFDWLTRVY